MKILNKLMIISFLLLFTFSCDKSVLNVSPTNQLPSKTVFSNESNAKLFLNNIYSMLPYFFNSVDPLDNWSDNSTTSYGWPASRNIIGPGLVRPSSWSQNVPPLTNGNGGTMNKPWLEYGNNYSKIRRTNIFIKNVSASDLPDSYKKEAIAQAHFLRAYFYQLLWMAYGGVPIVTNVQNKKTQGQKIYHKRSTFKQTYEFIVQQCDSAAQNLPNQWSDSDVGRPTKGAALTLKAWVQLFAASPTFNTSNPPEGPSKLVSFGNYKEARWDSAAATFKRVMDLNVYSLYPNYGQLFFHDDNQEEIFVKKYKAQSNGGLREGYMGPTYVNGAEVSWGGQDPTQSLVDAYSMDNGKPISAPHSGYDPQHPYKNRSKRFYESIVYDGSVWQGDTIYSRVGVGSKNAIDLSDRGDAGNTGYYTKKEIKESINGLTNVATQNAGHDFVIFRYAGVLLGYAEAKNEADGPVPAVYDAVNKVRKRVDLPGFPQGISQDSMRTRIHMERRVELAFEAKRWWDIIRWGTADKVMNEIKKGILIQTKNGELHYETVPTVFTDRHFDPTKNYVLPIPYYVIQQNPKIKQNPNY